MDDKAENCIGYTFIFRITFYSDNAFISVISVNVFLHLRFSYICSKMMIAPDFFRYCVLQLNVEICYTLSPQENVHRDFIEHYSS